MVMTNGARTLPTVVHLSADDGRLVPAPGTQRLLKAQTGRAWQELMAEDGDSADRFQTIVWVKLRRDFPDLTWQECDGVDLIIDDTPGRPDPTNPPVSTTSPSSADSGG
jgi:hypothetical protein